MRSVRRRESTLPGIDAGIFKSYDVRGIVPEQLNAHAANLIGRAFAQEIGGGTIALGRDMRIHSDELAQALSDGITAQGCDVVDVGRVPTDALYFAVGSLKLDGGAMVTASHNPPEYNGFKLCRQGAEPLSLEDGIGRIRETIALDDFDPPARTGAVSQREISDAYVRHALSFVDGSRIKPFRIVVDAGNGMAGAAVPRVFGELPCTLIPMFFELDGTFPNHEANPIDPANLRQLQKRIVEERADFGVAFDGDGDRMFLVDEKGRPLGGDVVTLLVALNLLKKHPGEAILYNLICSKAVPDAISRAGGRAVRTPVGHALIKPIMKHEEAVFGGEHSGHFYFRNNWNADSGLIAMLVALETISESGQPLSELVASVDPYVRSGEINTKVSSIAKTLERVVKAYPKAIVDRTDGITISFESWWFNVRPSNTEPLLRLNVEADSADLLEEKTAELLVIIKGHRRKKSSTAAE